jgi:hypothetical protein
MTDPGGPHVTAAVICERVLNEQDGVASIVRIIDRVFFLLNEDGEKVNDSYPFMLFVNLKSGAARGSYTVAIEMEKPSGQRQPVLEAPVLLEGEERGVSLVIQTAFEPDEQGLYWYDVFFEGDRLTRIPLRAVFQTPPSAGRAG